MGAWGHKPWENDSAMDWLGPIGDFALSEIRKALTLSPRGDPGYLEAIAAAALLQELSEKGAHPNVAYAALKDGVYDRAVATLSKIAADAQWISEWKQPDAMEAELARLTRLLLARKAAETKAQEEAMKRIVHVKEATT